MAARKLLTGATELLEIGGNAYPLGPTGNFLSPDAAREIAYRLWAGGNPAGVELLIAAEQARGNCLSPVWPEYRHVPRRELLIARLHAARGETARSRTAGFAMKFLHDCWCLLYVPDVGTSLAFYRDVLQFPLESVWDPETYDMVPEWKHPGDPTYVRFAVGARKINVHLGDEQGPLGRGVIHHIRVDDVDGYYAGVTSRGLQCEPPVDQPWGWRQFYACDPDGHRFSFYSTEG